MRPDRRDSPSHRKFLGRRCTQSWPTRKAKVNQSPKLTERHLPSVHDAAEPAADNDRPQARRKSQEYKTNTPLLFQRIPEDAKQNGDNPNRDDWKKQNADDGNNEQYHLSLRHATSNAE